MNNRKLVSILMPCYNAASYVESAVTSAIEQTWPAKEIIVVDDGSTDRSGEILDGLRTRGIKVIHQPNMGQSAAANRAFAESNGDYIKFFDADDLLERNTVELQVERLEGTQTAVASCEWGRFYGDQLATFKLNPQSTWRDMEASDWLVEAWRDARPMMQCALWLIPRAVLNASGGWDERLSLINDFEFFARVLCHSSEVRFTPGARLFYRSGLSGSLSGTRSRKAAESAFRSVMLGTGHLLRRREDAAARRSCANILQDFIYSFYPAYSDLRHKTSVRVRELGGSDLSADGSPKFKQLQLLVGWKAARFAQLIGRRLMRPL
jgi:glycosyltransferase involved in cell wall biosynthesis